VYIDRLSFPPLRGRDDFIQNCEHVIVGNPLSATQRDESSDHWDGAARHSTNLVKALNIPRPTAVLIRVDPVADSRRERTNLPHLRV
jgi:hypothetical protein